MRFVAEEADQGGAESGCVLDELRPLEVDAGAAVVEGPSLDAIGRLVTDEVGTIDGVTRTTTCVAVSIA